MAEIEFSVFSRQAWDGYIFDEATLKANIASVQQKRNAEKQTVNWRFTTEDARIKLKRLYPSFSN